MCGLAGFLDRSSRKSELEVQNLLNDMSNAIAHRGPDNKGFWNDLTSGIGLAHRRLAILDLSHAGDQPMISISGRYILALNGEIYNHLDLREQLIAQKYSLGWRGNSDTETLLSCFEVWGVENTLKKTAGMFALALWDREQRVLMLARDRMGEKPLYFGWQGEGRSAVFLFGSELAALRKHPSMKGTINRNALARYMRHNCIGGKQSIYQGIQKLPPGYLLTLSNSSSQPDLRAWWSLAEVVEQGVSIPFIGSKNEAVNKVEKLLRNSVSQQMISDVPIGAFLSGGIDSSCIVALMQAQSSQPVKTFSIGFNEESYNEAVHAKAVASHLGTDHTELYVTAQQALAVIPKLPTLYSEPFADSSQIPTFLVSQLASEHVKVSLSGDGGDELFCGYNRYRMTDQLWQKLKHLPLGLRRVLGNVIRSLPPNTWDQLGRPLSIMRLGDKLHKGSTLLDKKSVTDLYGAMVSHWDNPADLVIGGEENLGSFAGLQASFKGLNDVERMMATDMQTYLPDDILAKVDRAAMAVGLETRVPLLDHKLIEFAWSLPLEYKLRKGLTKWVLRQVLYRYVPPRMVDRPKMGFGVPIDQWLRGPLRDWAENLLSKNRLQQEGFLNPIPIIKKWNEHLSGKRNWQYHLWDILMFQAWLESNR